MASQREQDTPRRGGFFSGGATRTAIQLIVASILVGAIFSLIGLSAAEFWKGIFTATRNFIDSFADRFGDIAVNLITWLVIGGAVVIPIWLVAKVLSRGRR